MIFSFEFIVVRLDIHVFKIQNNVQFDNVVGWWLEWYPYVHPSELFKSSFA